MGKRPSSFSAIPHFRIHKILPESQNGCCSGGHQQRGQGILGPTLTTKETGLDGCCPWGPDLASVAAILTQGSAAPIQCPGQIRGEGESQQKGQQTLEPT